jgi:hypothetical protein
MLQESVASSAQMIKTTASFEISLPITLQKTIQNPDSVCHVFAVEIENIFAVNQ